MYGNINVEEKIENTIKYIMRDIKMNEDIIKQANTDISSSTKLIAKLKEELIAWNTLMDKVR